MLEISDISKTFHAGKNIVRALDDVSLSVGKGELFGLIGPDGGGKTTLFRLINNLLDADKGSISIDGLNVKTDYRKIREITGYMPARFSLYPDLSVEENLNFFATIFKTDAKQNLKLIKGIYDSLAPFKNRLAGRLSGGMKQKLALCCALITRPKLLLLDEPTTGVDPVFRNEFWSELKRLKNDGMTILVSTPYMEEAAMCDKIAFISKGKILCSGTLDELLKNFSSTIAKVRGENMYELLKKLRECPLVDYAFSFGDFHHAVLKQNVTVSDLKEFFGSAISIEESAPTIEDIFISLIK